MAKDSSKYSDWEDDAWEDDFESWQGHYELHESRDYPALVELCEREVGKDPKDVYAVERLGRAYLLNDQPQKAFDLMNPYHEEYPDFEDFAHILLDALFAMGKNESDYSWKIRPRILRIGPDLSAACLGFLRPKRKAYSVCEIHLQLSLGVYLAFSEDELLAFLQSDPHFLVEGDRPATSRVKIDRAWIARQSRRRR